VAITHSPPLTRSLVTRIAPFWIVVLIVGSVLPDQAKNAIGAHSQHRLYHLLSFGATAYLLTLIGRSNRERFYALLFVIALGTALELAQHLIFHSPFEWWDVRDDTIGVLAAAPLGLWPALHRRLIQEG